MKFLFLSFLAGLAGACGFQPLALWPLILLSLVGLLWLVEQAPSLGSALARGWWFGLGNFMLGLNWIATAFTFQAAMPAWLGWIAVILLSCYLAIYPATAVGLAWRYGRSNPLALVLWLAAAWIVTEWLRASLFTGFAWNPVGVALIDVPGVAGLSRFVGTYGLSGAALMIAGIVFLLWRRRWKPAAMVATAIAAGTLLAIPRQAPPKPADAPPLRIVQPNIGQEEKWKEGFAERNLARLGALSNTSRREPRLLLWPEAAVTEPLQDARRGSAYQDDVRGVRRAVRQMLAPGDLLLTGGITVGSEDGVTASSATNSVFAIDGSGRIVARYDKAHLVPYGEYLPARPILSAIGLSRLAPGDVDFESGPGPRTLDLPLVGKTGFQLCYEIIFSGEVVDRADRPDFLFNPSNDAWFGAWGPPQHLAQARLRALEEGLPVLRSTPTGISAAVDADGRLIASIGLGEAGVIDIGLPPSRPPTLFARGGNLLPLLFAFLLAGIAIAVRRKAG
ncbi:apolipoprotein N-acyltransferase [Sphingosinicella rhizophila]|uniref:Apolipoprotein N-acyltransferase n=1 Tax=Sphingosinicella rhizophila TaxID=3050082 RepID=A0ABU3QC40_9SPHN|nr:apolipoprotein N-acyltransferase [Sphingosinicella sp. GR2756]MDT9600963.1 apolipoprotein N-acyltransferase [Sphingosinicella sp. GR2756]